MTIAVNGGATAPPSRAVVQMTPWARPRCSGGNQRVKARAMLGNAPASPAPKANRIASSAHKLVAQPVSAVKTLHQSTTRTSTRLGPSRSPSQPVGTSNIMYESVKALKTKAICRLSRSSAWLIGPAACDMQTRSRYVIDANAAKPPSTW